MTPEELARFDEASCHPYECKCALCKEWWKAVGPELDDDGYDAPAVAAPSTVAPLEGETPRTDDFYRKSKANSISERAGLYDLARQLERELADLHRKYMGALGASEAKNDEIAQLRHDMERGMANHNADLNADPSSTAPSELEQKLDAIAKALDYPVESWRMAGCDVLAHAVGDLIANYGRLQAHFSKIDATLDELGAPADGEWEGIKTKLSRRGRIKALCQSVGTSQQLPTAPSATTAPSKGACRAPSSTFTIGASGAWYCGGCGASNLEPECRYLRSASTGNAVK